MRNRLGMFGVTGLMAGMLIAGGCGGGGDDVGVVPGETVNVTTSNAESFDASTKSVLFEVHPTSTYTFNVTNFAAGDKLVFDAGTAIDLMNVSGADRVIEITGSLNGKDATVLLTGISVASDGAILGVNTFNQVFGAGSLVAKN